METKHTVESLRARIAELEIKREEEGKILKIQLTETYELFKPVNILKSVIKDFSSSEGLGDELITSAAGFASGLITKKLIVGNSKNPFVNLIGVAVHFGINALISKNYGMIKNVISQLVGSIIGKIQEEHESET